MKKKIIIAAIILVILIMFLIKFLSTFIINEIFILDYNNGNYSDNILKPLYVLNIIEPCNVYYNNGNVFYKTNNSDGAIEKYKKALDSFPSNKKECKIRINLCLAMLRKIKLDNIKEEEDIDNVLKELENAKEVLFEHGCAGRDNDNGHNKDAEKLKKEIEEIEKKLKEQKQNKNDESKDDKKDDKKDEKKDDNKDSKEIENKLQEVRKQGTDERQNQIESRRLLENYSFYNGKKW